jgi:hypothetical protein
MRRRCPAARWWLCIRFVSSARKCASAAQAFLNASLPNLRQGEVQAHHHGTAPRRGSTAARLASAGSAVQLPLYSGLSRSVTPLPGRAAGTKPPAFDIAAAVRNLERLGRAAGAAGAAAAGAQRAGLAAAAATAQARLLAQQVCELQCTSAASSAKKGVCGLGGHTPASSGASSSMKTSWNSPTWPAQLGGMALDAAGNLAEQQLEKQQLADAERRASTVISPIRPLWPCPPQLLARCAPSAALHHLKASASQCEHFSRCSQTCSTARAASVELGALLAEANMRATRVPDAVAHVRVRCMCQPHAPVVRCCRRDEASKAASARRCQSAFRSAALDTSTTTMRAMQALTLAAASTRSYQRLSLGVCGDVTHNAGTPAPVSR